jgi:hypothetical protein
VARSAFRRAGAAGGGHGGVAARSNAEPAGDLRQPVHAEHDGTRTVSAAGHRRQMSAATQRYTLADRGLPEDLTNAMASGSGLQPCDPRRPGYGAAEGNPRSARQGNRLPQHPRLDAQIPAVVASDFIGCVATRWHAQMIVMDGCAVKVRGAAAGGHYVRLVPEVSSARLAPGRRCGCSSWGLLRLLLDESRAAWARRALDSAFASGGGFFHRPRGVPRRGINVGGGPCGTQWVAGG